MSALPAESISRVDQIHREGFANARHVLDPQSIAALLDALHSLDDSHAVRSKGASTYGVRHLCRLVPAVAELARSAAIRAIVQPILGHDARVVRSLLFDKTPGANWKVPWHQDTTIAVKERRDAEGFGPWSVKADVVHVQPPTAILQRMLTLRVHLDDCGADNGPLRVVPGSHRVGILDVLRARIFREQHGEIACTVFAGDAVLMRPLLLHASSPALAPSHRRVIHLEFASEALPEGLEWCD
jgi:ectoine hydroxylase-related dioxygenase (phytanoyl-CoA dioxygenase family)